MNIAKLVTATLLLAVFSFIPAPSQAEVKSGAVTLSPMIGGIVMEGDQNVDDGIAFGVGLGYNLTKALGLEAVLVGANLKEDGTENDADLQNYRLDALYHFMPDNALVPYAALGVGGYDIENDSEYMTNYGLGLLYFVTENVALRADARHLIVFNEDRLEHNLLYTAGLKFQFAERSKPVPAVAPVAAAPVVAAVVAPKDSDSDGVTDDLDKCPGTPAGVAVDANGCPLDSDGDSVPDYLDKCPGTPKGAKVDAKGCPLDSDGDGVPDYLDQCPDTVKGAPVDAKGCPLDSDGDGVFDYLDKCPDTPKGITVDSNGCELKLTLRINFDSGKAEIKPEFKGELDKAAAFVRANSNAPFILLVGHTDSQGNDDANQKLSERRAEAVRQALIKDYGLDANKLKTKGYGESQPVADNATADGRYQNRRVEVICCAVLPE